jgi:hypothetical protein
MSQLQKLFIKLVPQSEMKNNDPSGRHEGNIVDTNTLISVHCTSRAVFSFFSGLKRASVFLVFRIRSMTSSMVKFYSMPIIKEINITILSSINPYASASQSKSAQAPTTPPQFFT